MGILLRFGARAGDRRYQAQYDLNHDGFIDALDLLVLASMPLCHT